MALTWKSLVQSSAPQSKSGEDWFPLPSVKLRTGPLIVERDLGLPAHSALHAKVGLNCFIYTLVRPQSQCLQGCPHLPTCGTPSYGGPGCLACKGVRAERQHRFRQEPGGLGDHAGAGVLRRVCGSLYVPASQGQGNQRVGKRRRVHMGSIWEADGTPHPTRRSIWAMGGRGGKLRHGH